LAVEERPIAEQVLRGGIPAVREQIKKQNDQAKKENRPELPEKQVVAMAEKLLPKLRRAEWRDRADAALEDLEELDLRDLRSVVVAAEDGARDEESRAIAAQLSSGLTRRVESEHAQWVEDMTENLDAGRFVRALRISSRPPKAGAPVPKALAERLVATVSEGLNSRTKQEVYVATLEALSFSPIRAQVRITSKPENPSEDLLEAVKRTSDKLPEIAAEFGVDPKEANAARRRHRSRRREEAKAAKDEARNAEAEKRRREGPKSYKPPAPEPVEEQSDVPADAGEAPSELSEATGEESPEAAASETDAPEAEAPAADASEAEASETESPEVDASEAGVADTAGEGADAAADTGETDPDAPDAGGESAEDPEKSA
jgi:hypothetical protein